MNQQKEGSGLFVGSDLAKGLAPSCGTTSVQLLGKDPNDENDDSHLSDSRHARHSQEPVAAADVVHSER